MPLNLDKNKRDLVSSCKEVLDERSNTTWAVYGYEKKTDILELIGCGNGLESLADQFSTSQIMYAFCQYKSANSDLPKYFIINWQGEGAPPARKMACANHIDDFVQFFRGANMTIEARNEDDVDPVSIIKKLERITVQSFNLKERSIVENVSPVGTNYKRIQPQKEIDVVKRETFWSKIQEEDNKRHLEERKRIDEERTAREKLLIERQLEESSQTVITVIKSTKNEIKTDKDIKREFDRSKLGTRSIADNQWIKVKDTDAEKGQSNGKTSEEIKTSSYVKSRVESFKKAFEEGKPPIQPEKPSKKLSEPSYLSNQNNNDTQIHSIDKNSQKIKTVQSETAQLSDEFISKAKIVTETEQDVKEAIKVESTNSQNGCSNVVETKVQNELTNKPKPPFTKSEQTLNVESNAIPTPSPEPEIDQADDNLNAEIHETEEELNDNQSEDILNAEELEDEELEAVNEELFEQGEDGLEEELEEMSRKIWKRLHTDLISSDNSEADDNRFFTVKSSYLDPLEDIAEEAEENIEEEEEKQDETTEELDDESQAELKFLEEIEKRFPKSEYGLRARALYDYQAADETEITFDPDDIITHIEQVDVGWWQGMAPDGTYGLFPANYVQLVE